MKSAIENIEVLLNTNISVPAVLIDRDGKILKTNKFFTDVFGGDVDSLEDLIPSGEAESLMIKIRETFDAGNSAEIETELLSSKGREEFSLKISAVNFGEEKYLIVSFAGGESKNATSNKFTYLVEDIEEIIKDEQILGIINKIKSNFPFTIIGKNIVQNEINKLQGYFWIKDVTRKYILVNKAYAKYLGAKPATVEGKFENELLPAYIEKIFANTDSYIIETGNSVLVEGVGEHFFAPGKSKQKILEFPLLDIDNQVIAIVGLSYGETPESEEEDFGSGLDFPFKNELKKTIDESNKMYDEILKQFPEPIFIYDVENLKFLDVNPAALELYGYTREEFLEMDLTDLYAPEDIQSLIEASGKEKGNKYGGPWRQKRKDGTSIIVEIGKVNIEYEGKLAHMSVIHDLTYKMEMQKKLQLYKASFDNASDAILITDTHGFIKYSNDNFTKYFGYAKSDIDQSSFLSLVADDDRGKINKNVFQSVVPDVKNVEIRIKKSNGETVETKIIASPIFDFEDKVERYVLIVKTEAELAGEVREMKGRGIDSEFLSNLFHELLTPLNVIIGFVQELAESIEHPTEDQNEAIQIIKENQKVLLQTMDTAVEYSHLEQNIIQLSPSEISFVDLLEQLENSTHKISESNEVTLQYGKISSSLKFTTDSQKFLTFIVQILHFAIIMTKESTIYLSANYTDDGKFYVGIKDAKNRITSDLLNNLTLVFTDDENNIRRNFGLSRFTVRLVKKLLEILQAEYKPYPSESSPVEFALIFPLELKMEETETQEEEAKEEEVKPETPPVVVQEEKPIVEEPVKAHPTVNKKIDLSQLSCLYVEDQIDSQILFRVQMKELRSIEFATSLEKALPLLKSKRFDFILMDINLQGEYNGLDALKIIKKMPGYENVPIIAVTAYVVPGAAEKFIQAGFSEFITKPLLREKIVETLEKIFS